MDDKEYLNMMMSRMNEASQIHNTIHTFKIRFHNNPALPILIKLLEDARNNAIELAIQEYGILKEQERISKG